MEMTFGGLPKAEIVLLVLMLAQLVFLWSLMMYRMGKEGK